MTGDQLVVCLSTRFSTLEHRDTRWGAVLRAWTTAGRRFEILDFPSFGARPRPVIESTRSWLPGVRAWRVALPFTRPRWLPHDPVVARLVGRRIAEKLDLAPGAIFVATSPLWTPLALGTRHRWGFDAVDDWRALPLARAYTGRIDRGYDIVREASSVTSVSTPLAATIAAITGREVEVIPNGVDVGRFQAGSAPPSELPDEPFGVYVGNIRSLDRVLVDHLRAVVDAGLPVVAAGECDDTSRATLTGAGVRTIGEVPRALLPGLLERAVVGLVPHRATPLTTSMDPMKTLEYLASGLPVVATPVAARPEHGDRVTIAGSAEAFAEAAVRAASLPRQLPAAPLRSWDTVAEELWRAHTQVLDSAQV